MAKKTPVAPSAPDPGGNVALRYLETLIRQAHFSLVAANRPKGIKLKIVPIPQALKACEIFLKQDLTTDIEQLMLELINEIRTDELSRKGAPRPFGPNQGGAGQP
jgi:hypothetical protein